MSTILLHQCDICKKIDKSGLTVIPKDWFELEYQYNNTKLDFIVCKFSCYILQVKRCIDWSYQHSDVRICGMTVKFARDLLKHVDIKKIENRLQIPQLEKSFFLDTEPEYFIKETIPKSEIKRGSKVISIKIPTEKQEQWIEDIAFDIMDDVLLYKTHERFENENKDYDELLTKTLPDLPFIRYKSHYDLFIYEGLSDKINSIFLNQQKC